MHKVYKGFKGRQGNTKWSVMVEKKGIGNAKEIQEKDDRQYDASELFEIHDSYDKEKCSKTGSGVIKQSMFPDDEKTMKEVYKIHHSMRVMPHDQNSGGFFIAKFIKHKNVVFTNPSTQKKKPNQEEKPPKESEMLEEKKIEPENVAAPEEQSNEQQETTEVYHGDGKVQEQKNNYIHFVDAHPEDWKKVKEYIGLTDDFPERQLFSNDKGERTVLFVNKSIADYYGYDSKNEVNRVNLGIRAFEKSRNKHETDVNYRLTANGVETIYPFMTKRKYEITFEE